MIKDLMQSRRSVRRFRREKPTRPQIEELIEMAVTAPSASNKQPWRFFVTDDRFTIDRMAQAVCTAVERLGEHVEEIATDAFREYADHFVRFSEAPVVIVAAFREMTLLSHLVDSGIGENDLRRINVMERHSSLISTSMAVQNLLLYAHDTGLGASCMTGPMVAADEIKAILHIPDSWHIAAVIPVGFPDEKPEPTSRKPVRSVLRWVPAPDQSEPTGPQRRGNKMEKGQI